VRLILTALGRVWLDVRILETDYEDDETQPREPWPVDSQAVLTDQRIGFLDDVGRGSTFPYE
jgi:hypothetical protein